MRITKWSTSLGDGHIPFGHPNRAVRAVPHCRLSRASVGLQTRLHSSTSNWKKTQEKNEFAGQNRWKIKQGLNSTVTINAWSNRENYYLADGGAWGQFYFHLKKIIEHVKKGGCSHVRCWVKFVSLTLVELRQNLHAELFVVTKMG